jgi:hypothetical protein
VTAAAGRRDRGQHAASLRIDLLDTVIGDLIQVLAVKGGSRIGGNIYRTQYLPARRIESVQLVTGSDPDVVTVVGDPVYSFDTRKGSILTDDFGC